MINDINILTLDTNLRKISKFITKEMVSAYWNSEYNLRYIPEKYITQEMVDKYYRRNKDLSYIPISMITDDILFDYYDTYKTLNYISYDIDVPKELLYKFIKIMIILILFIIYL